MSIISADGRELNVVHDTEFGRDQLTFDVAVQLGDGLVEAGQFGRMLATLTTGSLATEYRVGTSIAALAMPMIVGARIVGVPRAHVHRAGRAGRSSVDVIGQPHPRPGRHRDRGGALPSECRRTEPHRRPDRPCPIDAGWSRISMSRSREAFDTTTPIACIMLDVDHFKMVIDVHGHQAGDEILSEFGSAFSSTLRETDTAYRYGGEEFCVLLRETDADAAAIVAERLRVEIAARFAGNRGAATVTASLGVAAIPSDAIDAKTLVAAADPCLVRRPRQRAPALRQASGSDTDSSLRLHAGALTSHAGTKPCRSSSRTLPRRPDRKIVRRLAFLPRATRPDQVPRGTIARA